jgi:hypothetical protein
MVQFPSFFVPGPARGPAYFLHVPFIPAGSLFLPFPTGYPVRDPDLVHLIIQKGIILNQVAVHRATGMGRVHGA